MLSQFSSLTKLPNHGASILFKVHQNSPPKTGNVVQSPHPIPPPPPYGTNIETAVGALQAIKVFHFLYQLLRFPKTDHIISLGLQPACRHLLFHLFFWGKMTFLIDPLSFILHRVSCNMYSPPEILKVMITLKKKMFSQFWGLKKL